MQGWATLQGVRSGDRRTAGPTTMFPERQPLEAITLFTHSCFIPSEAA